MDKKIKLVSYITMQTLVLLTSLLLIVLSIKYNFSIQIPIMPLIAGQVLVLVFLFNGIIKK
ncbi:MAG: hypothetical protein Q8900_05485 [Bacillota bacterium]|nr:hypothetical protein [Bacillota bacterium]